MTHTDDYLQRDPVVKRVRTYLDYISDDLDVVKDTMREMQARADRVDEKMDDLAVYRPSKQARRTVNALVAMLLSGPIALAIMLVVAVVLLTGCWSQTTADPGPQVSADPLAACAAANTADPHADIATLPACAGLTEDQIVQVEARYLADLLGDQSAP